MLTFTRNERVALIVLVFLLMVGGVISWLDKRNPETIEEFKVVPGAPPSSEQSPTQPSNDVDRSGGSGTAQNPLRLRVNVNLATAEELQELPRIGPKIAQRIVEHRQLHGPFQSLEQLKSVEGIGPRTVTLLDSLVVIQADTSAPR